MTSNSPANERILGSLRAEDGKGVARVEDRYDTAIDDLWSALTDPQRLARWYGEVEGDLRLGGGFQVRHADGERAGRVDACEPPQRLLVMLRDPDPRPGQPEETVIEAQLTAAAHQTILVVEDRGLPLHLLAAYGAGVQIHLEHLADHIAGRESGDTEERWDELLPHYEALAADVS
jgi:uncharacterized protein YndB with AHSA1/START domain